MLRFLHGAVNEGAVDIYLNGSIFFNRVLFTQFTPYIYVPDGIYEVSIFNTMTKENPILIQNIEIKNGNFSTLVLTGYKEDFDLLLVPENENISNNNQSRIRIVHLAPNIPEINILFDNETLFSNVDFKEITNYIEILPSQYKVEIDLSENGRRLKFTRIRIRPDRIYTLYILGNFGNFQIFQSLDGSTFTNSTERK